LIAYGIPKHFEDRINMILEEIPAERLKGTEANFKRLKEAVREHERQMDRLKDINYPYDANLYSVLDELEGK
jgi:hypothetical protein